MLFDIRQHLQGTPDDFAPSKTRVLVANLHSPEERPVVMSFKLAETYPGHHCAYDVTLLVSAAKRGYLASAQFPCALKSFEPCPSYHCA